MKLIPILLICIFSQISLAQAPAQNFNLGFEIPGEGNGLAKDWFKWGSYPLGLDSLVVNSGETAARIDSDGKGDFGSVAYRIPANYEGTKIQLRGYMKTENVEGKAGLLLRIDGGTGTLAFDNMQDQNIHGTNGWKKYSITLPFHEDARNINLGGILIGKGTAWFDDFQVLIDGKDIQSLKTEEIVRPKAELDNEFDEGSRVELPPLTASVLADLELLGRVWGFLKYHHPSLARGDHNWDYELFRVLPEYTAAKNSKERDQVLLNWIEKLGTIEVCTSCEATSEDAYLKPSLKWISQYDLEPELEEKIRYIYKNRAQGQQYYVQSGSVGNPDFRNEHAYPNMSYPDQGFRLLALYRYWNMMQYYFPYKHITDKNWNDVLGEYLPTFVNAKNELEYERAALHLIGELHDTHANLYGGHDKIEEERGYFFPPVHVKFVEGKLVVDDYFNPEHKSIAGLNIGDIITHIDGKPMETIVEDLKKEYPASSQASRLKDLSFDLLRSQQPQLKITYTSGQGSTQKMLQLYKLDSLDYYYGYRPPTGKSYKRLKDNIGYVNLANITGAQVEEIKQELKGTKGIVVDIRNYPSNFVVFSLGSWFVSTPTPFVKFTTVDFDNPGEFVFSDAHEIQPDEEPYKGKVVVLVNEISLSQAEYTAMAFRAGDNTTILGSTTAGADGNVSRVYLPGGLRTAISGIGVYYPDGTPTQRVGIVPDIEVHPTVQAIREGRDEVLEAAVEFIEESE